jgi:hypothetical protein
MASNLLSLLLFYVQDVQDCLSDEDLIPIVDEPDCLSDQDHVQVVDELDSSEYPSKLFISKKKIIPV